MALCGFVIGLNVDGKAANMKLGQDAINWAGQRGLTKRVLEVARVESGMAQFGAEQKSAIVFGYYRDGERVNYKARSLEGKEYKQEKGGEQRFYNLDAVLDGNLDVCWITEGEVDCLSLMAAGFPSDSVLSVPTGAPQEASDHPEEARKYTYVLDALEQGLNKVGRFIIAVDNDEPGRALRHDLVAVLGRAKCWFIDWPDDIKDANEALQTWGGDDLRAYLQDAQNEWPIKGIYTLDQIPEPAALEIWDCGFPEWEGKIKIASKMVSVVTGVPGHGKALALDTKVPTTTGWTTMGEIKVGDSIFDEVGNPCTVEYVSPIMQDHDCYKVTFNDGTEVVADAGHRWVTETAAARASALRAKKRGGYGKKHPRGTNQMDKVVWPSVVTTEEISKTTDANGKKNHAIKYAGPIRTPEASLRVAPYTLGAWLGDGSRECSYVHAREPEVYREIEKDGYTCEHKTKNTAWLVRGLKPLLRDIGVLNNKHVPPEYLRASKEQRIALLQGLMDTDGHCAKDRQCEFCNTNESLAEAVKELAGSLGIKARISEGLATLYGKDCGPKYRVLFTADIPVFRLPHKLARQDLKKPVRFKHRVIVACDKVSSVPVRCISVDSPSHLFLVTDSFIATHNTHFALQVWFNIALQYGIKVGILSAETGVVPHVRKFMRQFFHRKLQHEMSEEEKQEADDFIQDHFVFFAHPDSRPNFRWLCDMIEVSAHRHGCRAVLLDPWNKLEIDYDSRRLTETQWIGNCLDECLDMSRILDMHIQIIAHPTKPGDPQARKHPPDLYSISGSAQWANRVDQGIVCHRPKTVDDDGNRCSEVDIYLSKARFEELGWPCKMPMRLNLSTGCFMSTAFETHLESKLNGKTGT
jgi:hypothetical protein